MPQGRRKVTNRIKPSTTSFSHDQVEVILETLQDGGSIKDGCAIARVSVAAFQAAAEIDIDLAGKLEEAVAKFKLNHLRRINTGEKQWQSSAWMLEKKFAREYGPQHEELPEERRITVRRINSRSVPQLPAAAPKMIDSHEVTAEADIVEPGHLRAAAG